MKYFFLLSIFVLSQNLLGIERDGDVNLQQAPCSSVGDAQIEDQNNTEKYDLDKLIQEYEQASDKNKECIINKFRTALKNNADPNILVGKDPILIASINFGFFPIAYLLASLPTIYQKTKNQAFECSLTAKKWELMEELLKNGANPSLVNLGLLIDAITQKHEIISALVNRDDQDARFVRQQMLCTAISNNNVDLVKLLLQRNINPLEVDRSTALDLAIKQGREDCVKEIFDALQKNPNFKNNDDWRWYVQAALEKCPNSNICELIAPLLKQASNEKI